MAWEQVSGKPHYYVNEDLWQLYLLDGSPQEWLVADAWGRTIARKSGINSPDDALAKEWANEAIAEWLRENPPGGALADWITR
jgi:hypothetical protein